ncbi:MAG: hypothetical protein HN742_18480 [Lentisphaerae bacterium]|jgi:hypothetical protein|nr:hypothetical protein [Lentisphaerota bacterium]MBT4821892.1 hypothetical protein [Lentisphaerota bacterium]MBT5606780.1 hypothetical protein [Lentisphaerota bacterium]MBT7061576.1 hypothetical protein [Lentisphaerota bacterium]MBT7843873.1 hypothetical protein [Lentisphaerota bacterium]
MIERCPHCQEDVVFSRNICPACGEVSISDQRTEATLIDREKASSRYPVYMAPLEEELSLTQRRGRLLLCLATGILLAPDITYFLVGLSWISLRGWALLRLITTGWLLLRLWEGKRWSRRLLSTCALVVGVGAILRGILDHTKSPPALLLFCFVFGPLFVAVAWTLTFSEETRDFLRLRRGRVAPGPADAPRASITPEDADPTAESAEPDA